MFGLKKNEFELLKTRIVDPIKKLGSDVYIFGSRTKTTHHPFSDIDILIEFTAPPDDEKIYFCRQLVGEFLETDFPYKIDLVFSHQIAESYKKNIMSQKIKI